jgi:hypothetical protein
VKRTALILSAILSATAIITDIQAQQYFTGSNLPIIVINTKNTAIINEPKINAHMGIISHKDKKNLITDTFNIYNGAIGIELRGNSSQNFSKKSYTLETRDNTGNNLNVELLGLPADNDWILLATYLDRTFIREPLAHYISECAGEWSSHSRHCELVLNGSYQGIYLLIEKIKASDNRLNLSRLAPQDITGESITGGYIYEVTGFTTYKVMPGDIGLHRVVHYPKPNEIASQQISYIKKYNNEFRTRMETSFYNDFQLGYEGLINVHSFVTELITQEAMRNSDAYGWSAYFHKNKSQKINAGPVWDFDQSSGNSTYKNGASTSGWIFNTSDEYIPAFWKKLYNEPRFRYRLKLKWDELRSAKLSTENIHYYIDSIATMLNEAQERNFTKWPILGTFIWRETEGYDARNTYAKEVSYLKNYMMNRMAWMDDQLKDVAVVPLSPQTSVSIKNRVKINLYPNPANRYIILDTGGELDAVNIKIYSNTGILVQCMEEKNVPEDGLLKLDLPDGLRNGLYHLIINGRDKTFTGSFVVEK